MKSSLSWMIIIAAVMISGFASCKEAEESQEIQGESGNSVYDYLISQTGGKTSDDPVKLEVDFQLTELNLLAFYGEIERARKYVDVDFTKCDYADVDKAGGFDKLRRFDPMSGVAVGKNRIVSITLPADAVEINGSFTNFYNLRKISAANVATISSGAFSSLTNLQEADLPKLSKAGNSTFTGCTNLVKVTISASAANIGGSFQGCASVIFNLSGTGSLSVIEEGKALVRNNTELVSYPGASGIITFNDITIISDYALARSAVTEANFPNVSVVSDDAFYNCAQLKKAVLSKTLSIGSYTFYYCSKLEEAVLSNTSSIGNYSFYGTGNNALTVVLGSSAPEVGYNILGYAGTSSSPKIVTVKVPSSEDYDEKWQEAFKGKGSAGTGTVNENITLEIVEYTP